MSYSIGQAARMVDMQPTTLRCWERRYGWPKPFQDERGHRWYSITDIERIRAVIAESKGRALQEVVEGLSQQEQQAERKLLAAYAVLVQKALACLQDGPERWYDEAARKERERCLAEARELARERSLLPR